MPDTADLRDLTRRFAQPGRLQAIGLRPGRGQPAQAVQGVRAHAGQGLVGDRAHRAAGPGGGKRQVTLTQAEHLPVIAALAGGRWAELGEGSGLDPMLGTSEQSEVPGSRRHLNEAEGESRPGAVPHDQSKRLSIQPALAESSPGASMPVISTGG